MLYLQKPNEADVNRFIAEQSRRDFTYAAIGSTAGEPPAGYIVDRTRGKLGHGRKAFVRAVTAIQRWQHFQLGWVEPCWPETPIEEGRVVGILARSCGVWFMNACRIVYVIDEAESKGRVGFAYGTLPEHVESGEEQFTVEWVDEDESVWYSILAYSRPNKWYSKLGYPYVRMLQKRFARDSVSAMLAATIR